VQDEEISKPRLSGFGTSQDVSAPADDDKSIKPAETSHFGAPKLSTAEPKTVVLSNLNNEEE
jgi:hypothetical protein